MVGAVIAWCAYFGECAAMICIALMAGRGSRKNK